MSTDQPPRKCPKCGTKSTAKFCHRCGAAISENECANCQVALSPGARFCHECGAPTSSLSRSKGSFSLPWVIAGAAVVVSIVVVAATGGPSAPVSSAPGSTPSSSSIGAPDISDMTPIEQADALFEVVMIALERGDTSQVGFHAPMALGAYGNLDSLDADALYHVGLLRGALGDHDGMLAMADTLQAIVPGHLLATTLRKAAAEAKGDSAAVRAAYRSFLRDYGAETTTDRREYMLHQRSIEAFLAEARRATAGEGN